MHLVHRTLSSNSNSNLPITVFSCLNNIKLVRQQLEYWRLSFWFTWEAILVIDNFTTRTILNSLGKSMILHNVCCIAQNTANQNFLFFFFFWGGQIYITSYILYCSQYCDVCWFFLLPSKFFLPLFILQFQSYHWDFRNCKIYEVGKYEPKLPICVSKKTAKFLKFNLYPKIDVKKLHNNIVTFSPLQKDVF